MSKSIHILGILLMFFLKGLQSKAEEITRLRHFTTDYCTGFSEGTSSHPGLWKHCCVEHDLYLWAGGCDDARREADRRIYECVKATGASQYARLMYLGIRIGSYSPIKFQDRKWGNGWVDSHADHSGLSPQDIADIQSELAANPPGDLSPALTASFLENLKKNPCNQSKN